MIRFKTTLLYILSRLDGQRTVYAAYHILRGKRSSQTIQDIHLFKLQGFFGLYPRLSKEVYDLWLNQLIKERLLEVEDDSFDISASIAEHVATDLSVLKGFKYHKVDQNWFSSVQLLTQTISNLSQGNKHFIPITDDLAVQRQIKQLLNNDKPNVLLNQLRKELESLFNNIDDIYANVIAIQLSGFNHIGFNRRQVAESLDLYEEDVVILTKASLHIMLDQLMIQPNQYPLLSRLMDGQQQFSLTSSAQKTFDLLKKGYNLKRIESLRRLKESTIQDHIIEIATQVDHFDISMFVTHDDINRIIKIIEQTEHKRLKTLMEQLDHSVTYFQLRLVLAKYHTYKESVKV